MRAWVQKSHSRRYLLLGRKRSCLQNIVNVGNCTRYWVLTRLLQQQSQKKTRSKADLMYYECSYSCHGKRLSHLLSLQCFICIYSFIIFGRRAFYYNNVTRLIDLVRLLKSLLVNFLVKQVGAPTAPLAVI
jgi:hypothetical protein